MNYLLLSIVIMLLILAVVYTRKHKKTVNIKPLEKLDRFGYSASEYKEFGKLASAKESKQAFIQLYDNFDND